MSLVSSRLSVVCVMKETRSGIADIQAMTSSTVETQHRFLRRFAQSSDHFVVILWPIRMIV